MNIIESLGDCVEKVERFTGNILIAIMTVLVFIEVINRFVFRLSNSALEELNPVMLVWVTYMTVGILCRHDRNVRMEIVRGRLNKKGKNIIDLISYIAEICLIVFFGIAGVFHVKALYTLGAVSSTNIAYPLFIVSLCVPIGCMFILIHSLERLLKAYKSLRAEKGS